MNQLTTTIDSTMSSMELLDFVNQSRAQFNEKPVRHNDFIARCRDELEGELYENFVEPAKTTPTGKIPSFEAIRMTFDQCKLVAMRESKGVRRRVLARLNELEAQAKSTMKIPATFSEALMLAAKQAEQIEQQQAQLAIAAPKAEFVDSYVTSTGLKGFREVAKLLKANEQQFRDFLQERKIMYRLGNSWTAHQQHIDAGRFEVKAGKSSASDYAYTRAMFTPKGVHWIAGEWAKWQLRGETMALGLV